MFGFVTDLYNSITGNSGSKSATDSAKAGLTDAVGNINTATEVRAGQDNVQGSDAAAGYTGGGAAGGQPGGTELDVTRITSDPELKKNKEVGTSVNVDNPNGGNATFRGFPSLFNPYYLVRYHAMTMQINDDSKTQSYITDLNTSEGSNEYKGLAQYEQYKNPSTSLLISHYSNGPGANQPERRYSYSDFLYLKDYHPFNNNRLITLRRFMAPVYDELRVAIKSAGFDSPLRKPIAQALSYLGTGSNKLSDFTKMTVEINTTKISGAGEKNEAVTINEAENFLTGQTGTLKGNDLASAGIKLLSILSGTGDNIGNLKNWTSAYDPWKNGPLQDLVYGPVNVVTGAKIRERGLKFTQTKFNVDFAYSSKIIENVNQKAAMLDILSNTLALTYNHALFWGGENRYLIDRANFPLVRTELAFSLLSNLNDVSALKKDAAEQIGQGAKAVADRVQNFFNEFIQNGTKALTNKDNVNSLTEIASQYIFADNDKLKTLQRTILEKTKAELTGAPTGEWHLQVGNPFAPIMMIGNLWCTSSAFEFNDELSIDDFPTEFKFTCTLEHGRDRDASDIQSIFNAGGGRIYYPYKDATIDVNASSSTYNTESQVKQKSTEIINSFGRSATDAVGKNIADLVKINKKEPASTEIKRQIFQPIGSLFK